MIRAIDKSSIQKICSGQVVVDLATAVKEMVENALDSGATSVEVKLKDMGASVIEVSDNGSGIDPSNYDGIARKHFTSKLKDFEDIFSVSSFGFRGEALNALCELSGNFSITTKQAHQPVGTNLQFDRNGGLLSQSVFARTTGTSVIVENLFDKLPVRRKDFVKSIKKHFQKMVRVVQSYALISVGVKIIVTNTTTSLTATSGPGGTAVGSRQTVFATQSGGKLTDNVSILFGAKFASSLLTVEFSVPLGKPAHAVSESKISEESNENTEKELNSSNLEFSGFSAQEKRADSSPPASQSNLSDQDVTMSSPRPHTDEIEMVPLPNNIDSLADAQVTKMCTVRGLVSKVGLGVGRSDNDRQYTFCNGRPVDLPRFAKALNEVWRKYEMKQKPAFVLDITVPAGYFDVNLTPDKREVLIVQEAAILEQLREAVDVLYAPVRQTMHLNQGMASGGVNSNWAAMFTSQAPSGEDCSEVAPTSARNLIQSALADYLVVSDTPAPQANASSSQGQAVYQDTSSQPEERSSDNDVVDFSRSVPASQSQHLASPLTSTTSLHSQDNTELSSTAVASTLLLGKREAVVWISDQDRERLSSSPAKRARTSDQATLSPVPTPTRAPVFSPPQLAAESQVSPLLSTTQPCEGISAPLSGLTTSQNHSVTIELSAELHSSAMEIQGDHNEALEAMEDVEYVAKTNVWSFDAATALNSFKQRRDWKRTSVPVVSPIVSKINNIVVETESQEDVFQIHDGSLAQSGGSDASAIENSPTNRQQARILHKKDFPRMRILGQFNLGFVIAELDGDLYILDQHACDEKYRFELLQRTTQIHQQPLIHPINVETSAALELVIADNLDTFTRNGFKLTVDLAAPTRCRVKLHSVPFSKSVRFGVDDVNELASMIGEHHRGDDSSSDATTQRTNKSYLVLKNDSLTHNTSSSSTSTTSSTSTSEGSTSQSDAENIDASLRDTFRLPKLVAMYASRACRSAIMIGTSLHERDMQRVVSRLEHVEQPWNCPHGRPTLRHLVDLTPLREHSSHRDEFLKANIPAVHMNTTEN